MVCSALLSLLLLLMSMIIHTSSSVSSFVAVGDDDALMRRRSTRIGRGMGSGSGGGRRRSILNDDDNWETENKEDYKDKDEEQSAVIKPFDYLHPPTYHPYALKIGKVLLSPSFTAKDYLQCHHLYHLPKPDDVHLSAGGTLANGEAMDVEVPQQERYKGETLLYVTPWNKKGYHTASLLTNTTTTTVNGSGCDSSGRGSIKWVAPVWFQLRKSTSPGTGKGPGTGTSTVEVHGEHDIDVQWLRQLRPSRPRGARELGELPAHRTCSDLQSESSTAEEGRGEVEIEGGGDSCASTNRRCSSPGTANGIGTAIVYVVPRVAVELQFTSKREVNEAADALVALMYRLEHESVSEAEADVGMGVRIDGFTLEVPINQIESAGIPLIKRLRMQASKRDRPLKIVLVLPPLNILPMSSTDADTSTGTGIKKRSQKQKKTQQQLQAQHEHKLLNVLATYVDRFSIMTYDYSRNGHAVAPILWVKSVMQGLQSVGPAVRNKLLMGIPFYGWRGTGTGTGAGTGTDTGEDMTAEKMLLWLAGEENMTKTKTKNKNKNKSSNDKIEDEIDINESSIIVTWDPITQEHTWTDAHGRISSFPTPYMLYKRLLLAEELGVQGVAIWEGGQGTAFNLNLF